MTLMKTKNASYFASKPRLLTGKFQNVTTSVDQPQLPGRIPEIVQINQIMQETEDYEREITLMKQI